MDIGKTIRLVDKLMGQRRHRGAKGPEAHRSDEGSQHSASSALRSLASAETLRAMVDRLREGIYITDREGAILDANPAFLEMMGVGSLSELRELRATDLLVDPEQRERELELLAQDGVVREFELQLRRPDGAQRTVLDTCYEISDRQRGEPIYHGILVDITQIKKLEGQLRDQATRDPLTGCYNRRYLESLASNLDSTDATWGAVILDIDHFKKYNDQLGHQVGDIALVKTARFLTRQVRAEDIVCRIGGDEFLVVLVDADRSTSEQIIERMKANARGTAPVPFSLGWSVRRERETLESTIGRADQELIRVRVENRRFVLRDSDA